MNSIICTLFESTYHHGVAVLVNTLEANGFQGRVYIGYRGELPEWSADATEIDASIDGASKTEKARELQLDNNLTLIFAPLETDYHLTNYKPNFMQSCWSAETSPPDAVFYFDPDIVVSQKWNYFEDWVSCGLALCEDVNSPLPENHPKRIGWRDFYAKHGEELTFRNREYVNAGFIGVAANELNFLDIWRKMNAHMGYEIGGLEVTKVGGGSQYTSKGFAECFDCADQDALNAALESFEGKTSLVGQEAMAIKPGMALVPHALGSRKPWNVNFLIDSLKGRAPRFVDKVFWEHANGTISSFGRSHVAKKRLSLRIASMIGRFYGRR